MRIDDNKIFKLLKARTQLGAIKFKNFLQLVGFLLLRRNCFFSVRQKENEMI